MLGSAEVQSRACLLQRQRSVSLGFPGSSVGKESPAMQETRDSLEKEMATQSMILAWEIPWMDESGGLQSTGLQSVGCD